MGFDYERAYLYHQSDGHTVAACFSWLSLAPLFLDTERAEALEIGLTDASEGQASKF
ncbi:TPA: hypothetical protein JLE25_003869 [Escherichia coli]|nr:hypothetical protein [Escherichia coli]HAV8880424.1 hypothetical protein [Escherichia coli]